MIGISIGISLRTTQAGTPPVAAAPVNTVAPAITGSPVQDQVLAVSTGSWTGYPAPTFAYQWKAGGVSISGATSQNYTLVSGDVGANITCTVTATNGSGSASATSAAVGPVTAPAVGSVYTFFVAGQSNAYANGTVSQTPDADYVADPTVTIWTGSGFTTYQAGVTSGALSDSVVDQAPWGPEAELIRQYKAANPSKNVAIIKFSRGGTSLAQGGTTDWNAASSGKLFDQMQTQALAAVSALQSAGKTVVPVAFLWTQGEADAQTQTWADSYSTNLTAFMARCRTNFLGSTSPFIYGRMRTGVSGLPYIANVQAGQSTVAFADSKALLVDLDGVNQSTNLHPGTLGVRQIGAAYYQALTGTLAPTISNATSAAVDENSAFSFSLTALTPVTWSITGGADQSKFALSGSTLSMTAKDYEIPTDANGDNVYVVTVRGTSPSGAYSEKTISVTVNNVAEGSLYEAEADALFQREEALGTARTSTEKDQANTLFLALKNAGIFSKLDCLYVPKKQPSSAAQGLDWTRARTSTVNGAVTWAKATGWNSAGAGTAYIDTSVNPTTPSISGIAYNNIWWGAGIAAHGTGNSGGYMVGGPKMGLNFTAANAGSIGAGSSNNLVVADFGISTGRYYASRSLSVPNSLSWSVNGAARNTVSNNNSVMTSANISLFRVSASFFGSGTIEYFAFASNLTLAEEQAFDAAIAAYLAS